MEPKVIIQNVVASAKINQFLNLKDIVKAFEPSMVDYRPEVFPGLVFRIKEPESSTLIFKSGKFVCTGTKSEREAKQAVMKVVRNLRETNIITTKEEPEITIQNIVASIELGKLVIDLEKAVYVLHRAIYDPEQFPGVVYYMEEPKVVFLIFRTGKLVCAGAKREEDIYKALANLINILKEEDLIIE